MKVREYASRSNRDLNSLYAWCAGLPNFQALQIYNMDINPSGALIAPNTIPRAYTTIVRRGILAHGGSSSLYTEDFVYALVNMMKRFESPGYHTMYALGGGSNAIGPLQIMPSTWLDYDKSGRLLPKTMMSKGIQKGRRFTKLDGSQGTSQVGRYSLTYDELSKTLKLGSDSMLNPQNYFFVAGKVLCGHMGPTGVRGKDGNVLPLVAWYPYWNIGRGGATKVASGKLPIFDGKNLLANQSSEAKYAAAFLAEANGARLPGIQLTSSGINRLKQFGPIMV